VRTRKRPPLRTSVSSDQRFVEDTRRRAARRRRVRLVWWAVFFAVLAAFCYFVAGPYLVRTFGTP